MIGSLVNGSLGVSYFTDPYKWGMKKPWLVGLFVGDEKLPSYIGHYNKPLFLDPY